MATPQLVIGNKNYSSWSLRAWLALKHSELEFNEIRVPLSTGRSRTELLKHSAAGKVPVYKDKNGIVWDSLAICEFIAESKPHLWPQNPYERAWARSISAEMHAGFSALRESMPMNCRASGRHIEISTNVAQDIRRVLAIWKHCRDSHVDDGPWLFGTFTIADAMYAPVVFRFHTYGVTVDTTARAYMDAVLDDTYVKEWNHQAALETETIDSEEVGAGTA